MVNYRIINKCKDKSVILVDFFDTVMFRHIHSHQLMEKWAKALSRKYPRISEKKLVECRKYAISKLGGMSVRLNIIPYYRLYIKC